MSPADLMKKLDDEPFKPFRMALTDGSSVDIENPRMVIVGETSAIVPDAFTQDPEGYRLAKHWRSIAISHIVQFIDLPIPRNGQRRRSK